MTSRTVLGAILLTVGAFMSAHVADALAAPDPTARATTDFEPLRDALHACYSALDRQSQITLAVGAVGVIGSHQLDAEARDVWAHQNRLGNFDQIGNDFLGTGAPGLVLGTGLWVWGERTGSSSLAHSGQAQLEALGATALTTELLKITVQRERPDASDRRSFVSGHTSTVFASSQVLSEFYGWKIGSVGYALGAFTALSRMSQNRHWLSDTVGGAAVGLWIGHAFSRAHLDLEPGALAGAKLSVAPFFDHDGGGLTVSSVW